jgi:iron complex transport system permease protein
VGRVVPHAIRSLVGPPNARLIPLCAVGGAILLSGADTLGRSLLPDRPLPVGVVTALIGAPAMVALLRRNDGKR